MAAEYERDGDIEKEPSRGIVVESSEMRQSNVRSATSREAKGLEGGENSSTKIPGIESSVIAREKLRRRGK